MKPRHHLYLDDELTARLNALAARPGTSKSAIVADALRQYLGRRGSPDLEEALCIRLDRHARQLARIERDVEVLLESLGLYVHYQLTVTAPLPEADKAARAVGQERFQKFVEQVGRQMAGGDRVFPRSDAGEPP